MEATRFLPIVLQGFASTTFFTTRPFLTVLGFAFFARFGLEMLGGDVIASFAPAGVEMLSYGNLSSTPWLLSETVLIILGLLALLEFGATQSNDLRFWYNQTLWLVQPGSAFVVNYSFAGSEVTLFLEFLASLLPAAPVAVAALGSEFAVGGPSAAAQWGELFGWLGQALTFLWAASLAAITWLLGRLRAGVVEIVNELDEDNDFGLQTMMNWAETGWTTAGVIVLFILPSLALLMAGLTVATLFLIRKYFEHRERRTYTPCTRCAAPTHPSAPFCPSCKLAREQVRQVGLFGQGRDQLVADPTAHRVQLISRKRCPFCASRLKVRALQQACERCGTVTFAIIDEANFFLRALDARFGQTVLISFVLGCIPLIGLVPAMIYYRLSLISGLRSYLPRSVGCLTRWGVRLINIVLVVWQVVPGLGALAMPLMCAINFWIYRQVFSSAAQGMVRTSVTLQPSRCPACSAQVKAGQQFCTECGQQLQNPPGTATPAI